MHPKKKLCDTELNVPSLGKVVLDRKSWRSRRISRILGRDANRCQNYPTCNACVRCLPHRRRKNRLVNINRSIPSWTDARATFDDDIQPAKNVSLESSEPFPVPPPLLKRKYSNIKISEEYVDSSKKRKDNTKSSIPQSSLANHTNTENRPLEHHIESLKSTTKAAKEKSRQKEKRKRQKTIKQLKREEERIKVEDEAKGAEDVSTDRDRFFVRFPLDRVSDLSGRSVSRNFRKADLDLNDILAVSSDVVSKSPEANAVYECLQRPLYFEESCAQRMEALVANMQYSTACSQLKILQSTEATVKPDPSSSDRFSRTMGYPVLDITVLKAIEDVLKDTQEPHHMESSQNSEEKIKSLIKPVLRSLGLEDILVTNGFAWRETIGLRSTIDLGTHEYAPKSDVAIVQVLSEQEAKILLVFEAYSKAGQSHRTADENRADRVRLLIQGSYISRKEAKPSVVFYLTRDKCMETILVFPANAESSSGHEKAQFFYYAEKQPFYSQASWVNLLCQVINIVWTLRHH